MEVIHDRTKEFHSKEEYLLDMLEYYTPDPTNRRAIFGTACVYKPTQTSDGCAIGRRLPLEVVDKIPFMATVKHIIPLAKKLNIPNWMVNLGTDFLYSVQRLHDFKDNWNSRSGLSYHGRNSLIAIIRDNNLDGKLFEKYF